MKILFIGDIVAAPGRSVISSILHDIKAEYSVDVVIANAENMAHGRGVTEKTLTEMLNAGVDYFTGGDHLFWQKGSEDIIDSFPVVRPANYPEMVPGKRYAFIDAGAKGRVLLVNLLGRTFLNERVNNPFTVMDDILEETKDEDFEISIVDFHAEATSEKKALGFYLDGRVGAVVGTHTHVPTCDNMILPSGTMFVSDVGMTGTVDSVIGVEKQIIIDSYLLGTRQKFEWENTGRKAFRSVLLDTDTRSIDRVDRFDI